MTSQAIRPHAASIAAQSLRITSATVAVMLLALAVVHLIRHWLAEATQPVLMVGWPVSLLLVGLLALLRFAWRESADSVRKAEKRAIWTVASAAAFLWSCSLSMLSPSPVEMAVIWLVLLASEGWWWFQFRSPRSTDDVPVDLGRTLVAAALDTADGPQLRAELDKSVIQQVTRSEAEGQGQLIHGVVRCRFRPGERSQVQHIAFCPPLDSQPSVLVDQIDGPVAKVKVAQAESFGARFEIRLDRVCRRPADFLFEFFASTSSHEERSRAA